MARSPATKKKADNVAGEPKRFTRVDEKNEGEGDVTGAATEATADDISESDGLFSTSNRSSGVSHDLGGDESNSEQPSKKERRRKVR